MLLRLGRAHSAFLQPVLDTFPGSAAAYATCKLRTSYGGPCLRLRRGEDDAEQDIGFADGRLDAAGIAAFLGADAGFVTTWYDQSGNGRDAAQPDGASQMALHPVNSHRGLMPITANADRAAGSVAKSLVLPAALSLTRTSFSAFAVVNPLVSRQKNIILEFGAGGDLVNLFTNPDDGVGMTSFDSANGRTAGLVPPAQPAVLGLSSGPDSLVFHANGATQGLPSFTDAALMGGLLGNTTVAPGFASLMDFFAFIVFPRTLAQGEAGRLAASLKRSFGVPSAQTAQLILDGDSITEGAGASNLRNAARQLEPLLSRPVRLLNFGIYGQTLATMNARKADIVAQFDPALNRNICLVGGGSNDLNAGSSAAAVYGFLTSYTATVKAAGFKVVWATVTPRSDFDAGKWSEWTAYNQMLRENWVANADGLADYAAEPTIGLQAAASDPAYYADGVHPTTLTYGIMAYIAAPVISGLL